MNYSIAEVIEAVERSFHSIDIRVVATQEDGRWTAEVLVIRLSYESVEAATERLRQLEASEAERAETSEFWIALAARPFDEWPELVSQLRVGVLSIKRPYDRLAAGCCPRHAEVSGAAAKLGNSSI